MSASSPNISQEAAHCLQTSAHAPQTTVWMAEPRNMADALVAQMSAQVAISEMWSGAA